MPTTKESPTVTPPVGPTDDPVEHINAALESGDMADAYVWLQRLIESDINSDQVCTTAGLVAMQLGRTTEANGHFARALELAPDDFVTNYNMALCEMHGQRHGRARSHFRHLRRLNPDNVDLLNDLGVVWLQQGNSRRALASFSRAMKLDTDNSLARNNAMELCLESGLTGQAGRLLERQERQPLLSLRAKNEIHRWRQVLSELGGVSEAQSEEPVGASEAQSEEPVGAEKD